MKKVAATLAMGFILAGTTAAHADNDQSEQVAECKSQLTAVYGQDTRVSVIGRTSLQESVMTFRVQPRGEKHLRVSCTQAPDGSVNMMDRYGIALALPAQQDESDWSDLY